jgi:hypothetical protein
LGERLNFCGTTIYFECHVIVRWWMFVIRTDEPPTRAARVFGWLMGNKAKS